MGTESRPRRRRAAASFGKPERREIANNGASQRAAADFRDATGLKRPEEASLESDRSFRALANSIPQLAWMADSTGWIFWYNDRWYEYTGTTLEEMQGWGWRKVHHPDHVDRVVERIRHAFKTGEPWEDTFPLRSKTGEYRWFLSRAMPITDGEGNVVRWFGTNTDVTEQREAAEALRESEERYRLLADMIPQNIWTTDPEGHHSYFSRGWYDYSGATPEESVGEGWLKFVHPDDRERTLARWRHSLETGEPYEIEYRFRGTDGEYRWFLGKAKSLRNESGQIVEWFGTATDISERKRLDEEREQLLMREQDARAEAERRRDELERVTESRARLMRGFSHDVKNPLGAADGWARVLESGVYGELPDKAKHNVGRIRRSIRHALEVIESLHELARTEAGEIAIKAERVNLHELTTALAEEYRVTAETAGLSFSIDTSSRVPLIQTDASRVRQILGNLLSNAIKYTDTGGVTIRLYRADAGPGGERREYVKVDVVDTGPGIAADQQVRLFREFSRINAGDKPGTGLGLAISQRLAHMLGGRITLQSEQGRGSTFSLWLPSEGPSLLARAESALG